MRLNLDIRQAEQVFDFETGSIHNYLIVDFGGRETRIPCSEEDLQHYIRVAMRDADDDVGAAGSDHQESYSYVGMDYGVQDSVSAIQGVGDPLDAHTHTESDTGLPGVDVDDDVADVSPVRLADGGSHEPEPTPQEHRKESIRDRMSTRIRSKKSSELRQEARETSGAKSPRGLASGQVDESGNPVVPQKQKPVVREEVAEEPIDEDGFAQG